MDSRLGSEYPKIIAQQEGEAYLIQTGEETGQVVLTAPREEHVRIRSDSLPRWHIKAGVVAT